MIAALVQINAKEMFRGIFSVAGSFIWTFKWYFVALMVIVIFVALLERLVEIKKFRIIIITILTLALVVFFIWIYS